MSFLLVLLSACLLDLLIGDPHWLPHPVRLIGRFCEKTEALTRSLPLSEKSMGRLSVVGVLLLTLFANTCVLFLCSLFFYPLFWIVATVLMYTTIAARDLVRHASEVYVALGSDLATARLKVGKIVGRDTSCLDEQAIICACVESVAENMSDGVIAPLFWATAGALAGFAAGGIWPVVCAVLAAMVYKAINTMDSMFGYKNEQYFEFGSCPARLDDLVNYLPARISAATLVVAALFWGTSRRSLATVLRDHDKHASPNAGWPEAAVAGALGIQLGGDSWYFGTCCHKPYLGDDVRSPVAEDIIRANRLMLTASFFCLLLFLLVYSLVLAAAA
ncbi:MAG: cobalamin biosynthesis protein CobD [Desulfobulbus sp.]|nr:MAG: cobalamin biosynthesis protein CobD [Desulfobulbus sp.]